MDPELWKKRVSVKADVHHGEPCITGTRVPVTMIVGCVAEGMSRPEIIEQFPQLSDEDIVGALQYAAEVLHSDLLMPLGG